MIFHLSFFLSLSLSLPLLHFVLFPWTIQGILSQVSVPLFPSRLHYFLSCSFISATVIPPAAFVWSHPFSQCIKIYIMMAGKCFYNGIASLCFIAYSLSERKGRKKKDSYWNAVVLFWLRSSNENILYYLIFFDQPFVTLLTQLFQTAFHFITLMGNQVCVAVYSVGSFKSL